MLNITNQNGVTYDPKFTYRLTDMNGKSQKAEHYQLNDMNGITWADEIRLSIIRMNHIFPYEP